MSTYPIYTVEIISDEGLHKNFEVGRQYEAVEGAFGDFIYREDYGDPDSVWRMFKIGVNAKIVNKR